MICTFNGFNFRGDIAIYNASNLEKLKTYANYHLNVPF